MLSNGCGFIFCYLLVLGVLCNTLEIEDTPEVYAFHLDILLRKIKTIK